MSKKSQSTQLQCRFTSNPLLPSCIYYFLMFLTLLLSIYLLFLYLLFYFLHLFPPLLTFLSLSIYQLKLWKTREKVIHTHTQSNPTQNAQIQVTLILPKIHSLSVLKTLQKSNRQPKLTARNFLKTTSHDIN